MFLRSIAMSSMTFRALSDVYGKITSLAAITINNVGSDASAAEQQSKKQLAGIARAFAHVQCHILGFYDLPRNSAGRGRVVSFLRQLREESTAELPHNTTVYSIPVQKTLRLGGTPRDTFPVRPPQNFRPIEWIQDGFTALQDSNGALALLDSIYYKFYDTENPAPYFMAEIFSTIDGILLKPFPYPFLGSNILTDGIAYAFINKTTLPNALHDGEQEEIETAFRTALGVPHIFWLGGMATESTAEKSNLFSLFYAQPDPTSRNNLLRSNHLDMYVTLGGRYTDGNTTKELVFVAEITDESTITDGTVRAEDMQITIKATNAFLRDIANQIRACSTPSLVFEVVHIPIIADFRAHAKNLRPYNNCHVEVYGATKNVYLPRYDERNADGKNIFETAEQQVQHTFTQYGFKCIMVDNRFIEYSNRGGSLHCMSKVLTREGYTP